MRWQYDSQQPVLLSNLDAISNGEADPRIQLSSPIQFNSSIQFNLQAAVARETRAATTDSIEFWRIESNRRIYHESANCIESSNWVDSYNRPAVVHDYT